MTETDEDTNKPPRTRGTFFLVTAVTKEFEHKRDLLAWLEANDDGQEKQIIRGKKLSPEKQTQTVYTI